MLSNVRRYDLAVAYRIYPAVSKPAVGLPCSEDKFRLAEMCLRSFRGCLGPLRAKVWALLDGCPPEYNALFRKYIDPRDLVILELDRIGNRATFGKQLDILLAQEDSEVVYFAEDDYFYLPRQFPAMLSFLTGHPEVDFISPYDHLDCYTLDFHRTPKWLTVSASHHWRTAASSCMTFLTQKQTLARCESVFRSYQRRNDDCAVWLSLTKHRVRNPFALSRYLLGSQFGWKSMLKAWLYCWKQIVFGKKMKLWVPIPGMATHLSYGLLSPNVDWCALMQEELLA